MQHDPAAGRRAAVRQRRGRARDARVRAVVPRGRRGHRARVGGGARAESARLAGAAGLQELRGGRGRADTALRGRGLNARMGIDTNNIFSPPFCGPRYARHRVHVYHFQT